jgi:hypothetical protein
MTGLNEVRSVHLVNRCRVVAQAFGHGKPWSWPRRRIRGVEERVAVPGDKPSRGARRTPRLRRFEERAIGSYKDPSTR